MDTNALTRNFKVLIVDDTPKNIQVVAGILHPFHYDLAYATDGLRALDILAQEEFDSNRLVL